MDSDERPLRLLSLDGGGIRGLSSLYILKSIMTVVRSKESQGTVGPLYPCDYFDLIAGTSTGGLIAVMLGVLHMDIDSCINTYIDMAPKIFPVEGIMSGSRLGKLLSAARGQQRFNPAPFEAAIKTLIKDHLTARSIAGENMLLRFEAAVEHRCKIFMCVTSEALSRHFRLRNYESSWDIMDDCAIWQGCRATTAAPTFFPPMEIGKPPISYVDGGLGYNNPIRALMDEISHLWPNRKIGCIVSVGTGVPATTDVGRKIKPLFETMKNMSLDTEKIAREFNEEMESRYSEQKVYFRFNVQHGLGQIGLEEWEHMDKTKVATQDYLNERWHEIQLCASQILSPSEYIFQKMTPIRVTPSSNVPFQRDPMFVGRDDVMNQLHTLLKPSNRHNRVGLYGLGGIGKSQVAIEYSYIVRDQNPKTWVFWVHASSVTQFEQGFRFIATKLGLPGRDDPKADILQLVSTWLDDEQNGPWLLVLDNADDSKFFIQPLPNSNFHRTILSYIPQKTHGTMLITSRDRIAAYDLVGDYDHLVHLGPMDPSEALSLLRTKISVGPVLEDDAAKLLAALEYIPLAITQAGAYIRQKESVITLSDYYFEFLKNEKNQATLLNKDWNDFRRDRNVPNAVITAWEISFNQIRAHYQPAADMLSLMSLFNRQRIPSFLIRDDDARLAFLDAIDPLLNFSLINVDSISNLFDMHRLVQVATRKWLESHGLLQRWKAKAVGRMAKSFPRGRFENWEICSLLLPHAEDVILYDPEEKENQLQRAVILENTAWYISERGNDELAGQRREQSLKIRRLLLDQEDERITASMANLALTYRNQGRWKEAEGLEVQVLETRMRVLGQEHPDTLTSMANLALTYRNQGRWKEAEGLQVQVLETSSRVLGQKHPSTLTSMANLALTYLNQGRWKEAEGLEVQVLETRMRVLGQEHPDTLTSMANLASTYWNQGRWKEAEGLEVQVLETSSRVLGQKHPSTLTSMANLASTYWNQGRWKEAEGLEVQVLETSSRVLGQEHPNTLTSMAGLASTYWNQGRWKEAEGLEVQVLETRKRVLGHEHPSTLTSMANLAFTWKSQGCNDEALELMMECFEKRKLKLGLDHPHTISSLKALNTWRMKNPALERLDRLSTQ